MSGVEDRVKEFLNNIKMQDSNFKARIFCSSCGAELTDGSFKVIDGKFYCLFCPEEIGDELK